MTRKPNILFLLSDEHSFRFFGHLGRKHGGEDVATPALDRLAAQSTVFTDCYCAAPLCVPSRITILTGLEMQRSGGWDNDAYLDPGLKTIPKVLREADYTTCLVGKMHFRGTTQYHGFEHRPYGDLAGNVSHQYEHFIPLRQGDQVYGGDPDKPARIGDIVEVRTRDAGITRIPESQIVDQIIAEETLAWLREHEAGSPEKPWFLTASFSRPHFPLTAPKRFIHRYPPDAISEPFAPPEGDTFDHPVSAAIREGFKVDRIDQREMMQARAAYFANVAFFDEILGDLLLRLDAAGLLDNTIIVYASDHGEMAGELGTWWKSGWYEACARVPLMVSTPEQRQGKQPARRIEIPVSLLDLMPTFAALGGAAAGDVSGADLSAVVQGTSEPPDRPIVCDHLNDRWGKGTGFRMVRQGKYKLTHFQNFPPLFIDLEEDPMEQHNLFESAAGAAAEIRDELLNFVERTVDYETVLADAATSQAALRDQYGLDNSRYLPNQYQLSSGRIIEADLALYKQAVVTDDPATFFADWPKR